jgi:hypothetical protein
MRRPWIALLPALAVCASATVVRADVSQYPDLVAKPPYLIQIGAGDAHAADGIALRFSVAIANAGTFPLDLFGVPEGDRVRAQQCVAWVVRACTAREDVGEIVWHQAHSHWHLVDLAVYSLRRLDAQGQPDMSPEGLVRGGRKTSFCLEDSTATNGSLAVEVPRYQACTAVEQGISPGWEDVYAYHLEGQQLGIAGVPDGTYALVIAINDTGFLRETSTDNDTSFEIIDVFRDDTGLHITCHGASACG